MLWQSTATPFSIIKLVGQNITTGHKKCHSLEEKCSGKPEKETETEKAMRRKGKSER